MADITVDELAIHAFMTETDGPVAREMERRAIKVQNVATRLVHVDTGRLRASLDHAIGVDDEGLYVDVGTNVEYSVPVELRFPYLRPALAAGLD